MGREIKSGLEEIMMRMMKSNPVERSQASSYKVFHLGNDLLAIYVLKWNYFRVKCTSEEKTRSMVCVCVCVVASQGTSSPSLVECDHLTLDQMLLWAEYQEASVLCTTHSRACLAAGGGGADGKMACVGR